MKKPAVLPALALAWFAATSVPVAAAERSLSVTSFDRIRVDGPFKVRLRTGVSPFAKISGSTPALDRVSIAVEGRTLVVRPSLSSWGGYPGEPVGPVEINLGTHDLSQAWLNGAGSLEIDRVRGLSFGFDVQGPGSIAIARVEVDQLRLGLNGAASASLAGNVAKLTAIARGVSSLDASALKVKDASIGAEGPAQVKVFVSETLKIDARGTSAIDVAGSPSCTITAQGSATINGCR